MEEQKSVYDAKSRIEAMYLEMEREEKELTTEELTPVKVPYGSNDKRSSKIGSSNVYSMKK